MEKPAAVHGDRRRRAVSRETRRPCVGSRYGRRGRRRRPHRGWGSLDQRPRRAGIASGWLPVLVADTRPRARPRVRTRRHDDGLTAVFGSGLRRAVHRPVGTRTPPDPADIASYGPAAAAGLRQPGPPSVRLSRSGGIGDYASAAVAIWTVCRSACWKGVDGAGEYAGRASTSAYR